MLYNKLNEYYRYVYKYLTRKKFTLNKWLTFLPLNFYSFETQYKTLLSDLRCINITKLPIGTKEVFLCHGVSNSWYIKIPEEKQIETIAIREIVGSIFYSLFLDEKIEQHYYYEGDKAIISKEINTFTTFASHFHHILTYNVIKKEEFTESLLFNNNIPLP